MGIPDKNRLFRESVIACPTGTFSLPIKRQQLNMKEKTDLSASLEDYIEAIYHIIEEKLVARSKEIAARLGVSRASVTEALRALSKKGSDQLFSL